MRFRLDLLSVQEVRRDKGGITGESDGMRPLGRIRGALLGKVTE